MNKYIYPLLALSLFSGCSVKEPEAPKSYFVKNDKDGTVIIRTAEDKILYKKDDKTPFKKDLIKRTFKEASEYTLNNGYKYFQVLNRTTNHSEGFFINTYKDYKEYCIKDNRDSSIKLGCEDIYGKNSDHSEFLIKLYKDVDYRIIAFDAQEVLNEIKEEENK